jgi:spore coat protein U domain-containing protein, fimbrial subunit CupE1/2/3/6
MNPRLWISEAFAVFAILTASVHPAHAAGCVVNASPVVFGNYDPIRPGDLPIVSTISYSCSGIKTRVRIGLTKGNSESFRARIMRRGNRKLEYNLYLDPTGTGVWGDGSEGTQVYIAPPPPNGASVTLHVYGRIRSNQDVSAGGYRDRVSVTVSF